MPDFTKIASYEELMLNKKEMIEIGSGAFGVVFKFIAKDNELCAVKEIRIPADKYKQQRIQQLEKEKQFLCTYHHKNIVKGYFGFQQQTEKHLYYYLGMEFVGDNLNSKIERVINKTDQFTDELIFNYAQQLCNALYFLQIKNVAHQDLKPQNILIDKDNTLKICDFSEFRINTDAYQSMLATQIGTRAYMAPEHFRRNQKIIPIKADVYSYGVTILQCFLRCTSASIDCLNEKDGEEALNYLVDQFNEEMQYFFKKCTCHNLIERFDFLDIKIFLQAKLDKLSFQDKSEIKQLKNEISSLKQKNLEISNVVSNLQNENQTLQKQQKSIQNENQTLQKQQKSIQNENENLQKLQKSIQNENQTLQQQYKSIQNENEKLWKQQQVLQNDFKKLTDLVSQLQQTKIKPSNAQIYQQQEQKLTSPIKTKRKCDKCGKEFDFDKLKEKNFKYFCEDCYEQFPNRIQDNNFQDNKLQDNNYNNNNIQDKYNKLLQDNKQSTNYNKLLQVQYNFQDNKLQDNNYKYNNRIQYNNNNYKDNKLLHNKLQDNRIHNNNNIHKFHKFWHLILIIEGIQFQQQKVYNFLYEAVIFINYKFELYTQIIFSIFLECIKLSICITSDSFYQFLKSVYNSKLAINNF